MDAQQFLGEFGHIANAPGGISQLRNLILSFAVRGRLTLNALNEQATSHVVRSLISERKKNEVKTKFRILGEIGPKSIPYEIPDNWLWVRLGEVVEVLDGLRKPVTKHSRKAGPYPYYGASGVVDHVAEYIFDEPLVLIGEDGAKWGRGENSSFKISGKTWVNNHAHVVRPLREFIQDDYLVHCLVEMDLSSFITGMTVPKLNQARLISIPLPLPPLEEQSRIVAKVDELMALCDKLEVQQQQRRCLQINLRQSTLQAVVAAANPYELHTAWTRLTDNFSQLFHTPEDVKLFRDIIFNLAMRGMYLPTTRISTLTAEEDQPPLPAGWQWRTLGELSEYITSGSRGWKRYYSTSGDTFIRSQDIKQDALIFENPVFVVLPKKAEGKRTLVQEGDLLLTITGGNVGRCAFVSPLNCKAYVSQHVALIRLHDRSWAEYIHFWMINTNGGRKFLERYIYGDKPGLNLVQVASVPVPIPPKIEKTKILESLRHFQLRCDRLVEQFDTKYNLSQILAKAAVSSITGIATEQQKDEPVKVPLTELIAPLRLGKPPGIKAQAPLATILARHNGEISAKDLYQRFGSDIDAFYAQLKTEVRHGWILEPEVAEMREKLTDKASA